MECHFCDCGVQEETRSGWYKAVIYLAWSSRDLPLQPPPHHTDMPLDTFLSRYEVPIICPHFFPFPKKLTEKVRDSLLQLTLLGWGRHWDRVWIKLNWNSWQSSCLSLLSIGILLLGSYCNSLSFSLQGHLKSHVHSQTHNLHIYLECVWG